MTDNIKPTVQEKSAWAKIPQEFNDWWNGEYSDESNPFRFNSAAYWAWAGWSEAVRLNAQAVPDGWKLVPVDATDEMVKVGDQKTWVYPSRECWAAMLSAAPAAPQPAQQPLTDEQINAGRQALPYDIEDKPEPWAFKEGVRFAEQAHGIGVKT